MGRKSVDPINSDKALAGVLSILHLGKANPNLITK